MINKKLIIFTPFLVLLLFSHVLRAQEKEEHIKRVPEQVDLDLSRQQVDLTENSFERADRLMRLGEFQRAADLFESLLDKTPADPRITDRLIECYENLKQYSKMLLFVGRRIDNEPPSFPLYRDYGRAHLLNNNNDSAMYYFYKAASRADKFPELMSPVADMLYRTGWYQLESALIDSVRVLYHDDNLMADLMGDALAAQRRYGDAATEYLKYMELDSLAAKDGENRLIGMIQYKESADTVMTILSQRIKNRLNDKRLLNIYGQLLLEQGKYDEAFDFYKHLDSSRQKSGSELLYFIQNCNIRGNYQFTIKAGEYVLANYPGSGLIGSIRFELAAAYTNLGQYDLARQSYELIAADPVRPAFEIEAYLRLGLLYKDNLKDLDKAEEYLLKVTAAYPNSIYGISARFGLADIAVHQHKLDMAISMYDLLLKGELEEDIAERAEYCRALAFLFKDEYEEASGRFKQIINRYPRGLFVNDAIQYSLIIDDALGEARQQMDLYAASEYYRYCRDSDSLEYYLTKICKIGIPSLAPVSWLNLARLYKDDGDTAAAIAATDSLEYKYPDNYFLPFGRKLRADLMYQSVETREQAITIYRELLSTNGSYPFAAEIRKILRQQPEERI